MRTLLKVFLLSLFIPFEFFGQNVPGYLGKRFQVGMEGQLFPSFLNPNSMDLGNNFSLNYQGHLNVEYTLSKSWNMSIKSGLLATFIETEEAFNSGAILSNASVSAVNLFLGFKKFRQHFAPLGNYLEYRLGVTTLTVEDYDYGSSTNFAGGTISGSSAFVYSLGLGYGLNRSLFSDNLLFTAALEFNFSFVTSGFAQTYFQRSTAKFLEFEEGNSLRNQQRLLDLAKGRVFIHNLINFKFGVSYLIF